MIESRDWFDFATAALVFILSIVGIIRRCSRLVRLYRIRLVKPVRYTDLAYLASIKRSTYLRLSVKITFFIGSLIMLFQLPLFEVWRGSIVLALIFMNLETASVDRVRERLGSAAEDEEPS